jgi:hypothetical protein
MDIGFRNFERIVVSLYKRFASVATKFYETVPVMLPKFSNGAMAQLDGGSAMLVCLSLPMTVGN